MLKSRLLRLHVLSRADSSWLRLFAFSHVTSTSAAGRRRVDETSFHVFCNMVCAVCSKDSLQFCSKCCKIDYCSQECQNGHWKIHETDCFPFKVETSEEFGRYLVATKDIKQWDLILNEKAIVSGPCDRDVDPLCLGCFAILENPSYSCSICKWPVCNSSCEKVAAHSEFECGVFARNSVKFNLKPRTYTYIYVLRGLLLKEANPQKWNDLISLQSHVEEKLSSYPGMTDFPMCTKFIWGECGLAQFEENEIYHILGAIGVNSFGGEDFPPDVPRSVAHLFSMASIAAHSCVPNCSRLIDDQYSFQLRACVDIPAGAQVTTFYEDTWRPTKDRQENLRRNYHFSCLCKRCLDPTELGTHYSATSCNAINEDGCTGYLNLIAPEDEDSQWECNKCNRKTHDYMIREFNFDFQQLIDEVPGESSLDNLEILEGIVKSYDGKVHPNHHILVDMEYDIAQRIHDMLLTNSFSGDGQRVILNRQIAICNHQLEMADVLRPGFSVFRGKVLHLLQYAKMIKLLSTRPNKLKVQRKIKEIEDIRAMALTILSVESAANIRDVVESLKNETEMKMCKNLWFEQLNRSNSVVIS